MVVEMRVYHCLPGRLPVLHQRFQDASLAIWARHGIRQIGFFTTLVGPSNQTLTYLLQWESLAERETKWTALMADAQMREHVARYATEPPVIERVENSFLSPTAYSALR